MRKLIGHTAIAKDFQDLAASGDLGHGYIFHGPAMVGKRMSPKAWQIFLKQKSLCRKKTAPCCKMRGSSILPP